MNPTLAAVDKSAASAHRPRRRDLIDATLTVIAEHGLSNLTLAKVAALAGLTAGSVNFHFSSKEALLLETLRTVSEEFAQAIDDVMRQHADDPAEALLGIVDANFSSTLSEPRKVAVWHAFLAESRSRSDYLDISGERDETYFNIVLSLFRRIIAEAGREDDLDAEALAFGFTGLIDGLWQDILFETGESDRAGAIKCCRAYLASVMPWRFAAARERPPVRPAASTKPEAELIETLPSWTYTNDAFSALERDTLFRSAWQIVCHQNDVREPGDYVTLDIFGERAFVIRGKDGQIRAFNNVCPHRAHAVAPGASGHCKGAIQCPYHGWNFHLDGRLKAVSLPETLPRIDKSLFGLKPLDCELWMGFVFIRFRSEGPSVAERLAPFAEEFAHFRTADMIDVHGLWEEEHPVDWKNAIENYVEDYHFPTGHGGLTALMDPQYDREVTSSGALRLSHRLRERPPKDWSGRHYHKLLPDFDHLPDAMKRRWTYFGLFPNVFFDVMPESMDFFHVVPLGAGRMKLRARSYMLPNPSRQTKLAYYLSSRINVRVQAEDNSLTRSVQLGLASGAYSRGLLSSKEVCIKGFEDWIRDRLPVATLAEAPEAAMMARRNRDLLDQRAGVLRVAAE